MRNRTEESSQRSVFLPGSRHRLDSPSLLRDSFLEDVSFGLVPSGSRGKKAQVCVTLEPANAAAESLLGEAFNTSYGEGLQEGVADLIRRAAYRVCEEDRAIHEIVFFRPGPNERPTRVDLVEINGATLRQHGADWCQVVPETEAKARGWPQEIVLPRDSLLFFTMPPAWCRQVRDAREMLVNLGGPEFFGLGLGAQDRGIPYEFAAHDRTARLALADIGRTIGWTARGRFNADMLSFVWIGMHLRFERFKMDLRNHLLGELNAAIARIGVECGFTGEIRVSGLPTQAKIDAALAGLASGQFPFTEVMDKFEQSP